MNFTNRTEIIRRVQTALGLTADGIDGPLTWQSILSRVEKTPLPPVSVPVSGTLDARTEKNLATLDPKAQGPFRAFITSAKAEAAKHGCEYIAISGNRSYAEQDALYAKGRTTAGPKVTNAKGGESNHNFGIAMDFGVFRAGRYLDGGNPEDARTAASIHKAVAPLAKLHGIEWGGDWKTFKDYPHFEIHTGLSNSQKRARISERGSVL